ncbi:MAG: endonuclease [Candidatus Marinimicrobia bacterium]|nr:endonuclease [Candidatus Neomarinimicrobiota bacterium]
MNKKIYLVLCIGLFTSIALSQSQTVLFPGLTGQTLLDSVVANYKTTKTLGYNTARDSMYGRIDLKPGNLLSCVYTGYTITIDPTQNIRNQTNAKLINCEHTWPQSLGADSEPQASDLHHLYPTNNDVNSYRGNLPFAEIPDANTSKWCRYNTYQTTIPPDSIRGQFSEAGSSSFEPREDHKGNCARSMFYFFAIYNSSADINFWNAQKVTLLNWNYYDSVDSVEYARTWKIAHYQDNKPNPFVLDSTLARRIWFYQPTGIASEKTVPEQMNLIYTYPNPFNASMTIAFSLEKTEAVIIDIYDIDGKLIDVLYDEKIPKGNHSVVWNPRNLGAGLYLVRFTVNDQSQIKKCVYLK